MKNEEIDHNLIALVSKGIVLASSGGMSSVFNLKSRFTSNMKKGRVIAFLAILALSGSIIPESNAQAEGPKDLRIPMRSLDLVLDPQTMTDSYSMLVNVQLYRGLFKFNSDSEIEPDLVESWKVSSDHKEYRFKLRQRKFSDGTIITSEHVRQTFARMYFIGAAMGADLNYIRGVS
jgi:ABC-type transport system substrate-binding protein